MDKYLHMDILHCVTTPYKVNSGKLKVLGENYEKKIS